MPLLLRLCRHMPRRFLLFIGTYNNKYCSTPHHSVTHVYESPAADFRHTDAADTRRPAAPTMLLRQLRLPCLLIFPCCRCRRALRCRLLIYVTLHFSFTLRAGCCDAMRYCRHTAVADARWPLLRQRHMPLIFHFDFIDYRFLRHVLRLRCFHMPAMPERHYFFRFRYMRHMP